MTLPASVVIPTYNRAHLLRRAIESVLGQSEQTDELIVIDDGSTDGTADIVACYGDRIQYVPQPHRGAGAARNAGIRASRHPIVAFLDSDDEWLPGKLQLQRAVLEICPDVMFCFSDFVGCDSEGRVDHHLLRTWHGDSRPWEIILGPRLSYSSLVPLAPGQADFSVYIGDLALPEMLSAYISTITLAVRRDKSGEALHFAEDVVTFEDLECFGRLALLGRAAYMDCETACNHGHSGPRLTDAETISKATSRVTILERVWGTDTKFLARHGREYAKEIAHARCVLARAHLVAGNQVLARKALRTLSWDVACVDRIVANLPTVLLHQLLRLRKIASRLAA